MEYSLRPSSRRSYIYNYFVILYTFYNHERLCSKYIRTSNNNMHRESWDYIIIVAYLCLTSGSRLSSVNKLAVAVNLLSTLIIYNIRFQTSSTYKDRVWDRMRYYCFAISTKYATRRSTISTTIASDTSVKNLHRVSEHTTHNMHYYNTPVYVFFYYLFREIDSVLSKSR